MTMGGFRLAGVIPARYYSSRFPGKPLADLNGHPMIYHVYQQASKVVGLDRLVVATDDERIRDAVVAFGGEAMMTSSRHATGTDRVAEAVQQLEAELIVNIQGDEPLLKPEMVAQVLEPLLTEETVRVTSLISPVREIAEAQDLNVVKVVTDLAGDILCYSRAPIPYPKERRLHRLSKQLGLYAFHREALERFAQWEPTPLEITEGVELFRFLEHGWRIRGVETAHGTAAVDTPADLKRVCRLLRRAPKVSCDA